MLTVQDTTMVYIGDAIDEGFRAHNITIVQRFQMDLVESADDIQAAMLKIKTETRGKPHRVLRVSVGLAWVPGAF